MRLINKVAFLGCVFSLFSAGAIAQVEGDACGQDSPLVCAGDNLLFCDGQQYQTFNCSNPDGAESPYDENDFTCGNINGDCVETDESDVRDGEACPAEGEDRFFCAGAVEGGSCTSANDIIWSDFASTVFSQGIGAIGCLPGGQCRSTLVGSLEAETLDDTLLFEGTCEAVVTECTAADREAVCEGDSLRLCNTISVTFDEEQDGYVAAEDDVVDVYFTTPEYIECGAGACSDNTDSEDYCEVAEGAPCNGGSMRCEDGLVCNQTSLFVNLLSDNVNTTFETPNSVFYQVGICEAPENSEDLSCDASDEETPLTCRGNLLPVSCSDNGQVQVVDCTELGGTCVDGAEESYCSAAQDGFCSFAIFGCDAGLTCALNQMYVPQGFVNPQNLPVPSLSAIGTCVPAEGAESRCDAEGNLTDSTCHGNALPLFCGANTTASIDCAQIGAECLDVGGNSLCAVNEPGGLCQVDGQGFSACNPNEALECQTVTINDPENPYNGFQAGQCVDAGTPGDGNGNGQNGNGGVDDPIVTNDDDDEAPVNVENDDDEEEEEESTDESDEDESDAEGDIEPSGGGCQSTATGSLLGLLCLVGLRRRR